MGLEKPRKPDELMSDDELASLAIKVNENEDAFARARAEYAKHLQRKMELQAKIDASGASRNDSQNLILSKELSTLEEEITQLDQAFKQTSVRHAVDQEELNTESHRRLH